MGARSLAAAAALRGADDVTDPDVAALRALLTRELGEEGFAAEFGRARRLPQPAALELLGGSSAQ